MSTRTPTLEQSQAIELFVTGSPLVIKAGAGCLSGSTIVHINRAGKGSPMTLAHVVAQLQGAATVTRQLNGKEVTQGARGWDLTIPTRVAFAADSVVRLGLLTDAWCSGDQEVFDVSTVGGRTIRATAQHPFLTAHGWRYLRDLAPGLEVAVNTGRSHRGSGRKPSYRYRDTRCHPHQTCRSAQRQRFGVAEHRLVVEAGMNGLGLDEFLAILRRPAAPDGLVFLDPEVHVHHRDEDRANNARSNLAVMTEAEHLRHHAASGSAENVLWQVGIDTVAHVELAGVETTYDLAMADEPHNFVANGFVVHNTGKTTTLGMCARATQRTGTYLAFNKAIATDAARAMPMSVDSRTVHSVAWRTIRAEHPNGQALLARVDQPRVAPWKTAKHLGLGMLIVSVPQPFGPDRRKSLQPTWQAGHVMRAVANFCNSADPIPTRRHFPYVDGIDPPTADGRRTHVNNHQVAAHLEDALQRAWADLTTPVGALRFSPDVYLKLWQLGGYQIPGDFVLFDEAQDASPVMLAALRAQHDKQVIYVGDSNQQIYEWRGAVDALDLVDPAVPRTLLTQSWRFGQPIADIANLLLARLDSGMVLQGNPGLTSVVHSRRGAPAPRAVLCRTNAAAVDSLLRFQERGLHPHLVGGTAEIVSFAEAAIKLQAGQSVSHRELACFDSWQEVQDYVADDPGGGDLRTMVKLLDDYGPQIVMDALSGLVGEDAADVVISTAHKAKGREWETVHLASDFEVQEGAPIPPGELRLLYVAATRATHHLDVSVCAPLRQILVGAGT